MQWAFTPQLPLSPAGRPLKRSTSNPQLPPHAKRAAMSSVAAAAAQQSGGGSSGNVGGLPAVDVQAVAEKHGWDLQQRNDWSEDKRVVWLPVAAIRRPLQGSRSNDPEKVAALMRSIADIGLQEPIDVLEVDGRYWGFSGCHRFEAHQRLGREQILCRVRKATPQVLRFHMM